MLIVAYADNLCIRVGLVRAADFASREFRSLNLREGVHAFLHLFLVLRGLGQESINGVITKLVDMQNISVFFDHTKGGQHSNMNSMIKVGFW